MKYLFDLVDCEWNDWSPCDKVCGPGSKFRKIKIQAKFGGKNCSGENVMKCNINKCPGLYC